MENLDKEDLRVYEVGYLLVPTVSEEEVPTVYGNLKELITSMGGELISDEMPKMIELAYTMSKTIQNVKTKFHTGYFGWVKFFMDPEQTVLLKKKLDLDVKMLRFLILKTVKENTIATKRFVSKDATNRRIQSKKVEKTEEVAIDKEEVDKEIDAMVAN